jgi:hypothetical protein
VPTKGLSSLLRLRQSQQPTEQIAEISIMRENSVERFIVLAKFVIFVTKIVQNTKN